MRPCLSSERRRFRPSLIREVTALTDSTFQQALDIPAHPSADTWTLLRSHPMTHGLCSKATHRHVYFSQKSPTDTWTLLKSRPLIRVLHSKATPCHMDNPPNIPASTICGMTVLAPRHSFIRPDSSATVVGTNYLPPPLPQAPRRKSGHPRNPTFVRVPSPRRSSLIGNPERSCTTVCCLTSWLWSRPG